MFRFLYSFTLLNALLASHLNRLPVLLDLVFEEYSSLSGKMFVTFSEQYPADFPFMAIRFYFFIIVVFIILPSVMVE